MKQELLEYLVRSCVREVLKQKLNESSDEMKGAAAPPGDGLGTADQPPIEKDKEQVDEQLKKAIKYKM